MNFYTRKLIKPEDLNANNTLFGGSLLRWLDEEAAIYTIVQLGTNRCVTKFMSEINFISSAKQGDIVELGIKAINFGRTSLTLTCQVRNKITQKMILTIDKMVFVSVDDDGLPTPHGKTVTGRVTTFTDTKSFIQNTRRYLAATLNHTRLRQRPAKRQYRCA
jgi:acyl-CoA hydrolase